MEQGEYMENYISHLDESYDSYCNYLLKKYGSALDDYFSEKSYNRFKNGEVKTLQKKKTISRTQDGLYCHHIDEDKQIWISNLNVIKSDNIPFEYQKKERLLYCDLIEHGILHILIAKESLKKVSNNEQSDVIGLGGYLNFIRPIIVQWLIEGQPLKSQWMINCRDAVYLPVEDAKLLVSKLDNFLITNLQISQEIIDRAYLHYLQNMTNN